MTARRIADTVLGWLRTVAGPGAADDPDIERNGPTAAPKGPDRPEPSPAGRAELSRLLDVLAGAGMFAPRVPDPTALAEAVADQGEPVTAFAVLQGLHEAGYHHPGFLFDDHTARLAFHADQVEQDSENLRSQAGDLDRLAGDGFDVAVRAVEVVWIDGDRAAPTRMHLTVGGRSGMVGYRGAAKYLSTVLHVKVARALRTAGAPVRLASLASDAGTWIAAVSPDLDLGRLNDDLDAPAYERWEWLDEQEPHAAGESR